MEGKLAQEGDVETIQRPVSMTFRPPFHAAAQARPVVTMPEGRMGMAPAPFCTTNSGEHLAQMRFRVRAAYPRSCCASPANPALAQSALA